MLKKILFAFLITLLISSFVFAVDVDEDWIHKASSAVLNLNLTSSVELVRGEDSFVKDLEITSLFYPKTTRSTLVSKIDYFPKVPLSDDDALIYKFKDPEFDSIIYGMNVKIENEINFYKIKNKIPYPLGKGEIPPQMWVYLNPAVHINSDDDDIKTLSQKLIAGKDDLYDVAYTLAEWVNENIEYVLDSSTADVAETASWVLENRRGVCDELTSLYIALLRSAGVPARYVSGIAYTNLDIFDYTWGFHGWAQVYFPGYGWIDFDPTYGQMGYVDVSHIPLKYSVDSGEAATKFSMRSYDTQLKTKPIAHSVDIENVEYDRKSDVDVKVSLNSDRFNFGSYGMILVEVENLKNYYNTVTLVAGKTTSLDIMGREEQSIMLKPYESKKIYWMFKIDDTLDFNSEYVFPIVIYDFYGNSYENEFYVSRNYNSFEKDVLLDTAKSLDSEQGGFLDVEMICISDKSVYYEYENIFINCTFENLASASQEFNVCFLDDCHLVNLSKYSIDKESFVGVDLLNNFKDGFVFVDVISENSSKKINLPVYILSMPNIVFEDLLYPEEIKYGQGFEVSFKIVPDSDALYTANLLVESDSFTDSWNFSFSSIKPFKLQMNSESFIDTENEFHIALKYRDFNNVSYLLENDFVISLTDLSFYDRISLFFNYLGVKIASFFT